MTDEGRLAIELGVAEQCPRCRGQGEVAVFVKGDHEVEEAGPGAVESRVESLCAKWVLGECVGVNIVDEALSGRVLVERGAAVDVRPCWMCEGTGATEIGRWIVP